MTLPEYIRPKEVRQITGLSETTVRRLCDSRAFPTIRIGRAVCIDKKAFATWLRERRTA